MTMLSGIAAYQRVTARVVSVTEQMSGAELAVAATSTDVVLTLDDAVDFEEGGGQAELSDDAGTTELFLYASCDRDANTLSVPLTLAAAWAVGAQVRPFPYRVSTVAYCEPFDGDADGETISVRVPYTMRDRFAVGERENGTGETVELAAYQEGGYVLADVLGQLPVIDGDFIDPTTLPPADASDGLPPSSSPAVTITTGIGVLFARWTGIGNADPVTYEVHVSTSSGFTPSAGTLQQEVNGTAATIRTTAAGTPLAAATTYYVRLIARDVDGSAAVGVQGSGQITVIASDGTPPSSSPTPTLTPGIGSLTARWSAAAGTTDLVTYEVHLSTSSGFTASGATRVGETAGLGYTILTTAAGAALVIGTTYYCRIIARDVDGTATQSAQSTGAAPLAVTSNDIAAGTIVASDIAANTITAAEIAANAIGADEISANAVTAGKIAADAVTATQIAADSITTSELAAEAVHADNLQAILVMASRLVAGIEAGARIELGNDALGSYLRAYRADGETETFYLNGQTGDVFVRGTLAFGESILSPDDTVLIQGQTIEAAYQTPRLQQSKEVAWSGTSRTVSWSARTRPGSLLIAAVLVDEGHTLNATGINASPWTAVGTDQSFDVGGNTCRLYVRKIEGAAARTQEAITISASGDCLVLMMEFTGIVTASAQDQIGTAFVVNDDVLTVTTPTTTQTDELVLSLFGFESITAGIIAANIATSVHELPSMGAGMSAAMAWGFENVTATGAQTDTATEQDAQNIDMIGKLVTFRAASSPTSTVPTPAAGMTSLFTKLSPSGTESKLAYKDDAGIEHILTGYHGASVYMTTNQIISSGATTVLDFNAESFKTVAAMHDNVTNNPRLVVPAGMSGLWRVTAHVEWDADATQHSGPVIVAIRKNGTAVRTLRQIGHTNTQGMQFSWVGPLVVGDYMQIAFTSTGEARTIQGGTAGDTSFSWEYLGPVEGV